jgi:hypothetical protein
MPPLTVDELRAALLEYIAAVESALTDYRAGRIESMVRTLRCGALELRDQAIVRDSVKNTIQRMIRT